MIIIAMLVMFWVAEATGHAWMGVAVFAFLWPALEALSLSRPYRKAAAWVSGFIQGTDSK